MAQISKFNIDTRLPQPTNIKDLETTVKELSAVLSKILYELQWRLNNIIEGEHGHVYLEVKTAEPQAELLKQGMIVYADGTSWNPGSGEGVYRYNGTAWVFLG